MSGRAAKGAAPTPRISAGAEGARPLVVVGGGEHARVLMEAALSRPDVWRLLGFLDPNPCEETAARLGVKRLGGDDAAAAGAGGLAAEAWFVVGVGAVGVSDVRPRIVARYQAAGVRWACVVHDRAMVSDTASLGEGTVVFAGVAINTGARIGEHCVINTGAIVEHDVVLGAFTQVGPAAALGGGARVGERSYLGLGSRVRDHITLGARVTVGMGAAVVGDVAEGASVVGVPARPVGTDSPGGEAQ